MEHLPPELLLEVIKYNVPATTVFSEVLQPKKKELLLYSAVNKSWKPVAQAHLLNGVDIRANKLHLFIRFIKQSGLGHLVRRIRIEVDQVPTDSVKISVKIPRDILTYLFKECPNVVELQICRLKSFNLNLVSTLLQNLQSLLIDDCTLKWELPTLFPVLKNLALQSFSIPGGLIFDSTTFPNVEALYINKFASVTETISCISTFEQPIKYLAVEESVLLKLKKEDCVFLKPQILGILFNKESSIDLGIQNIDQEVLTILGSEIKCLRMNLYRSHKGIAICLHQLRIQCFNLQLLKYTCAAELDGQYSTNLYHPIRYKGYVDQQRIEALEKDYAVRPEDSRTPASFWNLILELESVGFNQYLEDDKEQLRLKKIDDGRRPQGQNIVTANRVQQVLQTRPTDKEVRITAYILSLLCFSVVMILLFVVFKLVPNIHAREVERIN